MNHSDQFFSDKGFIETKVSREEIERWKQRYNERLIASKLDKIDIAVEDQMNVRTYIENLF